MAKHTHISNHGNAHQNHHEHMLADFKKDFGCLWPLASGSFPFSFDSVLFWIFGRSAAFDAYFVRALIDGLLLWGRPFLSGAIKELNERRPGMMSLIGMAILVAHVYSGAVLFGIEGKVFFWELVTLIDIMLLGHWIEMRSVKSASSALEELAKMMPSSAHLIKDDSIEEISVQESPVGTRFL